MRWTATMILFNIQKLHIFNNLKIIETLLRHTLLFLKPQKFRSIKKKNGCLLNSCEVYPHDSDLTVFLSTKNELKKFFSNPPVKIVFVSQKKKNVDSYQKEKHLLKYSIGILNPRHFSFFVQNLLITRSSTSENAIVGSHSQLISSLILIYYLVIAI